MRDSSIAEITPESRESQVPRCPKCASRRVGIGYPNIQCLACGWSEPLVDFPVSWDFHRQYCREYGVPDPGPCEPPEHNLEEANERLRALEIRFNQFSDADLRRLGLRQIREEVEQLRLGLQYTQRLIPQKTARKGIHKRVKTTEV